MDNEYLIRAVNLCKRYGRIHALENVNIEIPDGSVFGIFGPNGAGKSTFISILATVCSPSSGDIFVDGRNLAVEPSTVRKLIGYVPQEIALYPTLSALDNLRFWAGVYGVEAGVKKTRIDEALALVGLEDRAGDRVAGYSGGMKRRLNIAAALTHQPRLLVLDEPTAGVDLKSRRFIMEAVKRYKENGRTVVFTSHYIDEMDSLCDNIAIMQSGRVLISGTTNEVKRYFDSASLEEVMLKL